MRTKNGIIKSAYFTFCCGRIILTGFFSVNLIAEITEQRSHTVMVIMDRIALILTIVGALNWGSIGVFGFDIVAWICGGQGAIWSRIIYTIVALAGIWCISLLFREREFIEPIEQH